VYSAHQVAKSLINAVLSIKHLPDKTRKEVDKNNELREIKEHELTKKIVKDINVPKNVTVFYGYIGKSSSGDSIRLYVSLSFNEYLEIKKEDITVTKEVSEDVLPFGGTCIFVNSNAEVNHIRVEVTKELAKFLGGRISQDLVRPTASTVRPSRVLTRAARMTQPTTVQCLRFAARARRQPRTDDTCPTDCNTVCVTDCNCTYEWPCGSVHEFCPEIP
jgi:hypothetical protein